MDRGKRVTVIGVLWVAADAESAAGPVELETVTVTATKTIEAEQPQSLNNILKALPNIERRIYTIGYRYDDPKNPGCGSRRPPIALISGVHKNLVSQ
jgi:hypothetical protein